MTATTAGNGRTRSGGQSRAAKGNAARRVHARTHARNQSTVKKWSKHVTENSDAMDLEHDVFKTGDADAIAASLKRSASKSHRRKWSPFQSAMSMLNFYTNRAGRNLSKSRRQILQDAKKKLREAFGRAP
ncbi:MAG: hypothetical protein JWQ79_4187 [Mucilaginibacter sp.]|nr:hypothetical protein [Mucilaginibacter sp.]